MPIVNNRGRVLGRWNIIDLAVVGGLFVLVVMGVGALLLFRTPVPSLASITPAEIAAEQPRTLFISGDNFRQTLSVRLGLTTAPLLVQDRSKAEVRVTGLPPGTYDLVLFDQARELVRMPDALTVAPLPQTEIQGVGAFVYLTEQDAARIRTGATLATLATLDEQRTRSAVGEVLAVLPPEVNTQRLRRSLVDASVVTTRVPDQLQVPAIVRFRCVVAADRCKIDETDLVRNASVPLALSASAADPSTDPSAYVVFRIDEIRPSTAPTTFPSEVPPVSMEIDAVGEFINLSEEDALHVRTRSQFGSPVLATPATPSRADLGADLTVASVVATSAPETGTLQVRVGTGPDGILSGLVPNTWQVPAIIRVRCVVTDDECRIGESSVSQGAVVPLAVPRADGEPLTNPAAIVLFRIERLGPVGTQTLLRSITAADAVVRVKFLAKPEVAGLPMAGDGDFSVPTVENAGNTGEDGENLRATIVSVATEPQSIVAQTMLSGSEFEETLAVFEATLKVPVILTSTGWQYGDRPIKVGAPFRFEGPTYVMEGWVLAVQVGSESQRAAP